MPQKKSVSKEEKLGPVDILIGQRLKVRRNLAGMTQDELAQRLGISFQQIQKYESAQNKVSASRLYHIAKALKIPVGEFYDEKVVIGMSDQDQEGFDYEAIMSKTETVNLIRAYYDISDKKKRKIAVEMMKSLQS